MKVEIEIPDDFRTRRILDAMVSADIPLPPPVLCLGEEVEDTANVAPTVVALGLLMLNLVIRQCRDDRQGRKDAAPLN